MFENNDYKLNITSSTVDKALDIAKDFLGKLVMPAVEETGLLFKDHVALWRFNNQIKILNKAKEICEKNNINPKTISLKILCPYLEYASLEEDDYMQDKWASLLTNLVDSEQNIENNIFPWILSQISKEEFLFIENMAKMHAEKKELARNEISDLEEKIKIERHNPSSGNSLISNLTRLETNLMVKRSIVTANLTLDESHLKSHEFFNLIRLGLVNHEYHHSGSVSSNSTYRSKLYDGDPIDLDVDIDTDVDYVFTDLGKLFIGCCLKN